MKQYTNPHEGYRDEVIPLDPLLVKGAMLFAEWNAERFGYDCTLCPHKQIPEIGMWKTDRYRKAQTNRMIQHVKKHVRDGSVTRETIMIRERELRAKLEAKDA